MLEPDSSLDGILLRQYLEGGECRSNRKRAGSDITTGNWCMLFEDSSWCLWNAMSGSKDLFLNPPEICVSSLPCPTKELCDWYVLLLTYWGREARACRVTALEYTTTPTETEDRRWLGWGVGCGSLETEQQGSSGRRWRGQGWSWMAWQAFLVWLSVVELEPFQVEQLQSASIGIIWGPQENK